MRVLFLVTDDWFFWSHRASLARAVRDAGGEVVVATSRGRLAEKIEAEGFRLEPVSFGRNLVGQVANLGLVRKLEALYRRHRPDVVHHVSFLPIFYGSLAARRARVPVVVNAVTGLGRLFIDENRSALRRVVERAYRASMREGAGASSLAQDRPGTRVLALFQNPDDQALFLERGLARAEASAVVHGSGVDLERFRPSPERPGTPVVLFCSRMLWSKGVGDLVEASRILQRRGVAHELLLVGAPHDDNPDSLPADLLTAWHAEGVVRWLGRRSDVPELLGASHVVCLPSYYREGVPLALIEGAACARALVTTDMPGCREIVQDAHNGLLVPARRPVALADALGALLVDPERRAHMGALGRALVEERFSAAVVNRAILAHYRRLLAGAPAPPALLPGRSHDSAPARRAASR